MMSLDFNKRNAGFTLVELLVAMTLGLVVLGGILQMFVRQHRTNAVQQQVTYAQQNVRAAMDLMVREIRGSGYNPTNADGFEGILAASATYVRIQSDLNADGDTDDSASSKRTAPDLEDPHEDVTYKFDKKKLVLRRGVRKDPTKGKQPPTMIRNVTDLRLGYELWDSTTGTVVMLDPPAEPLTQEQRSKVRAVIIRLAVRTEKRDPDTRQFHNRQLATRVRIRNIGFQDLE